MMAMAEDNKINDKVFLQGMTTDTGFTVNFDCRVSKSLEVFTLSLDERKNIRGH